MGKTLSQEARELSKGEARERGWLLAVTVVDPAETPAFA